VPATGCGGPLLVPVRCRSCLQSRQRGVAGTYAVSDMPAICCRPVAAGGCACWSSRASPLLRAAPPRPPAPRSGSRGPYPPGSCVPGLWAARPGKALRQPSGACSEPRHLAGASVSFCAPAMVLLRVRVQPGSGDARPVTGTVGHHHHHVLRPASAAAHLLRRLTQRRGLGPGPQPAQSP
jgi:hypothetical protein